MPVPFPRVILSPHLRPSRFFPGLGALALLLVATPSPGADPGSAEPIRPFLEEYCFACHSGDKVKGKVDFAALLDSGDSLESQFELWEIVRDVLEYEEMPPEDELQPAHADRETFLAWYRKHFVEEIEARPGEFRPRRLSAIEYRHTIRSLVGFDLEVTIMEAEQTIVEKSLVMKLLPTDPPGASGFTNDTRGNPLSSVAWEQYSYLADAALDELFSRKRRTALESFAGPLGPDGLTNDQGRTLLVDFLERAYRRPLPETSLEAPLAAVGDLEGKPLVNVLKREMKAALMSPAFLHRGLLVEGEPGTQQAVDDFELAERLSYFLWADMPDAALLEAAKSGTLSDPEVLEAQVIRLLESPKARSLSEVFASQWMTLGEIEGVSNNPPVAHALHSQPLDFMDYLFRENRPVLELVDSQTAFVNPHTSKYYPKDRGQMERYQKQKGIEVERVANQRITLENTPERGGILTMPGVLAMNKGPILRGTWILERILGDHLSDPPADVGQVAPNRKGENLSFRERFEQHRENPSCAVCHDKIDPLGFALQQYGNGGEFLKAGATAEKKKKNQPEIPKDPFDTSGQLPSGETFANFTELREILVTSQRRRVITNVVEKTLAYALCRKLEMHDRPTVEAIAERLDTGDGTYRDLVREVVHSLPFREASFPSKDS